MHTEENIRNLLSLVSARKYLDEVYRAANEKHGAAFSMLEAIGYNEDKLSNVICHLLSPNATHGQGGKYLKVYLEFLLTKHAGWGKLNSISGEVEQSFKVSKIWDTITYLSGLHQADYAQASSNRETDADGRRIDITTKLAGTVFGIENKIDAEEQPKQIDDYLKKIQHENVENKGKSGFIVFLCREKGRMPKTVSENNKEHLSFLKKVGFSVGNKGHWIDKLI